MSSLLLIAEQFQGKFRKVTFNALGFAKNTAEKLGLELHVLVLGDGIASLGEELATYNVKAVHVADDAKLAHYMTEPYTQVVCQVANDIDAEMITGAATVLGKDLLPRVAARLGIGMVSDIVELVDGSTFKRPVWAGAVIAKVRVETPRKVVSIRGTAFDPAQPEGASSDIENVAVSITDVANKVRFVSLEETKSERPELTEADIVVSGGRAVRDEEGVKLVEDLADVFGAALGASRAACDAGLIPNDLQVGQTGKAVAPDLYVAVGISGAIQHLAGMKSSKTIVVINKDPDAPIFQVSDYGIVADLFKAVPELTEKVKAIKNA